MYEKTTPVLRAFLEKDRSVLKEICLGDPAGYPSPVFADAMAEIYLFYYLDRESGHCFIAADEDDRPAGYILCCTDFARYKEALEKKFPSPSFGPGFAIAQGTLAGLAPFAGEYPAHLHIDLAPAFQGKGLGSALMRKLIAHLKACGIPGLMLNVAAENEGAVRFYRKNGFSMLSEGERLHAMGIRL